MIHRQNLAWSIGLALACAGCVAAEKPAAEPLPATYFGMHIHRADSVTRWPQAGFGSWRLWDAGVDWAKLEPEPGVYRFAKLDGLVALAQQHGVEPMLTLAVTPRWAASRPEEPFVYGKGGASPPRNFQDWERFVATLVHRYGLDIPALEIWNEPKYSEIEPTAGAFFTGTVRDLVELTCRAHKVAKSIEPGIRIVAPGFTGAGDRLARFLEAGGGACVDIIGFHFYERNPVAMRARIRGVKRILEEYGVSHLPLWNTEQGYEVVGPGKLSPDLGFEVSDQQTHAAYIPVSMAMAAAEGVRRFYFYSWERTLIDGVDGPASQAFKRSVQWLKGTSVSACRIEGEVGTCDLHKNGRRAWMVWAETPLHWAWPATWGIRALEPLSGKTDTDAPARKILLNLTPILMKQDVEPW